MKCIPKGLVEQALIGDHEGSNLSVEWFPGRSTTWCCSWQAVDSSEKGSAWRRSSRPLEVCSQRLQLVLGPSLSFSLLPREEQVSSHAPPWCYASPDTATADQNLPNPSFPFKWCCSGISVMVMTNVIPKFVGNMWNACRWLKLQPELHGLPVNNLSFDKTLGWTSSNCGTWRALGALPCRHWRLALLFR